MVVGGPDGLQVTEGTTLGYTPGVDPEVYSIDWRYIDYSHSNGYPDEACPMKAFIGTLSNFPSFDYLRSTNLS
jgi:hypothetical protein